VTAVAAGANHGPKDGGRSCAGGAAERRGLVSARMIPCAVCGVACRRQVRREARQQAEEEARVARARSRRGSGRLTPFLRQRENETA